MIEYRTRESLTPGILEDLLTRSWDDTRGAPSLARSLTWVTAHDGEELVGFVNVAWDGGAHAFLLDTTVDPSHRRRGIGTALVRHAIEKARESGAEWIHVDYEAHLGKFYEGCGFQPTHAGVFRLR